MASSLPLVALLMGVVAVVTLSVALLGLVRIRKDRPSLKSYEMGWSSARTEAKTDAPETASLVGEPESHMRARDGETSALARLGAMLWALTGIPLLAGDARPEPPASPVSSLTPIDSAAMGNTAAPTRTLLCAASPATGLAPEVEAVRAPKAPSPRPRHHAPWHPDDARSSDEEDSYDADSMDDLSSQQTNDETFEQMRAHMVLDGLQFYTAVASVSLSTVAHAVDIALFRATTIVLRERRKAHEDASIQAIESLYPDIMCLPPGANVRFAGIKAAADARQPAVARAMSPRHLETGFLTAA